MVSLPLGAAGSGPLVDAVKAPGLLSRANLGKGSCGHRCGRDVSRCVEAAGVSGAW